MRIGSKAKPIKNKKHIETHSTNTINIIILPAKRQFIIAGLTTNPSFITNTSYNESILIL